MKKIILGLLSIFFLSVTVIANEIKTPFDGGTAYIPQVDGHDDLSNIRIVYDDGWTFFGRGTEDGYPIEGDYENQGEQIFYSGKFDENERFTGYAELETPLFHYIGYFSDGKKNGNGILYNKKTNTFYDGNFVNDERSGEGVEYIEGSSYSYKGSWINNKKNGYGEIVNEDGTKYSGYFENGNIKGEGTKINTNGDIITGNWINSDIPSGDDCNYIGLKGQQYHGEISDGKFEGYGTFIDANGTKYEGTFIGNQRTGFGQQVYPPDENGKSSVYTGYFFGNQRNKEGTFEFSNGYTYEGGFLNGVFYGNGFLTAEENEEITVIASSEWNGLSVPEDSEGASTFDEQSLLASITLPRSGKILFSNGDMWEGYMDHGNPIAGLGIWTTQDERLAKIEQNSRGVVLCSYQYNNNTYDLSSIYTDYEIQKIITSDTYLTSFNDYYLKHKATIDKVVGGLQTVAAVLSILPSPIQPVAAGIDIGLSIAQITLKTISTSEQVYDVCVAGNQTLIPGMLKDYGKDIVWDAVNCLFASAGSMDALGRFGSKIGKGMGKAGQKISQVTSKAISKSPMLSKAAAHLDDLAKVGKANMKAFVKSASQAPFFKYVAQTGGKVTRALKTNWIKMAYPKLFKQYGDDITNLLFRFGNDLSGQLAKNGDIMIRAAKKHGDDVCRLFLKNGDGIANAVRMSKYPDDVMTYITKSGNFDEAVRLATKHKSVGKLVNEYGDKGIRLIDRFGEKAIIGLNVIDASKKTAEVVATARMVVTMCPVPLEEGLLKFLVKYTDDAVALLAKHNIPVIELFEKVGLRNQDLLVKILTRDGDDAFKFLRSIAPEKMGATLAKLENLPIGNLKITKIIDSSNALISKLPIEVQEAIGKYTTKTHRIINRNLRNGVPDELADLIKGAISKSKIPEDVNVFRGVDGFLGDLSITMRNGKFNLPKPGEIISSKAFTSTSLNAKYAGAYLNKSEIPILQQLFIPKGSEALYISDFAKGVFGPKQQELLLNAGAKFKIVDTQILEAGTEVGGVILEKATALVKMVLEA